MSAAAEIAGVGMAEAGLNWAEIFDLFRYSFGAVLVAGLVCPLLGCFLLVRRAAFYGIALPQFGAAGIAFGFAILPWWIEHVGLHGLTLDEALESTHAATNYHVGWAAAFTLGGLLALGWLGRRGATEAAWIAGAFALASAATLLLAQASPVGIALVEEMLHGVVLAVGVHDLETIAAVYALVVVLLALFRRELVLCCFDRDTAHVLGIRAQAHELLLLALIGAVVAVGVMIVGPLVLFGLLVLPPLAARLLARSMRAFFAWSSALGALAGLAGMWASFRFDWPMGAAVVVAGAAEIPVALLLGGRRGPRGRPSARAAPD